MIPPKYWSPTKKLMVLGAMAGGKTVEDTATGNPLTFTTDIAKPLKSLLIPFTPQQEGTGDPSPENIRSIIPWNGLTVFHIGANLYKVDAISKTESGVTWTVNADGTVSVDGVAEGYTDINLGRTAVPKKATLIMSGLAESENVVYSDFYLYNANGNIVTVLSGRGLKTDTVIDLSQYPTVEKIAVTVKRSSNVKTSGIIKPMLQVGTLASEFEPYTPITETDISFPSPVYGGEHEAVSGRMLVKWAKDTLTGEKVIAYGTTGNTGAHYVGFDLENVSDNQISNAYCDKYKPVSAVPSASYTACCFGSSGTKVYLYDPAFTDEETAKSILNNSPVEFVYKLATPTEQTLTGHQITALKGDNTIWSDADGSMTAVYLKKG